MAPKLTDDTDGDTDREFLDDIGLGRDGEHLTVGDDASDGGAWSPVDENTR